MAFRLRVLAAAGAAAAVTMTVGVLPAFATTTFTVTAGSAAAGTTLAIKGATTGTTPQVTFTDTTSGIPLNCDSATAAGTTVTGTGLAGTHIGKIAGPKTTWTNCQGPVGLVLNPTGIGNWYINATSFASGVTKGKIVHINANVASPDGTSCVFTVTGTVPITYTNSTHILKVTPTAVGTLTVSNVPAGSCFNVINNGDKASFSASYSLTAVKSAFNPIAITAP